MITDLRLMNPVVPGSYGAGDSIAVGFNTNTNGGPYNEYRTVFYRIESPIGVTATMTDWYEWAGCRKYGPVTGQSYDKCYINLPHYPQNYRLRARATINYNGPYGSPCGTPGWIFEPNRSQCGDYQEEVITYTG